MGDDTAIDFRIQRDDLAVAVAKAEKDVEAVRVRRTKEQARIDAGQVTNPKDLERLQAELANIDRRIGVLEDEELSGGDFVRNIKQLIDLLRQIGEVAAERSTRSAAAAAAEALFRGVISASSAVGATGDEDVDPQG